MNDSTTVADLLSELTLANTEIHTLRQKIRALESALAMTANLPEPAWVVLHRTVNNAITDLMRIPKFMWDSRPRVTITYGWSKGDK